MCYPAWQGYPQGKYWSVLWKAEASGLAASMGAGAVTLILQGKQYFSPAC